MVTNHPTVIIREVIDRSKQGVTEPFICRGDDGAVYFVKGARAGRRSQICEWVAAQVATAFGLPVATHALAEVPTILIEAKVRPDIGELGAGVVFASQQLPHVQELTLTTRALVPPDLATDVLVFDWWLRNEDRKLSSLGGNPNLLWDVATGEMAVIDHNQAFDRDFNAYHFLETHVFSSFWGRIGEAPAEQQRYLVRMKAALARINAVRDSIPESWWWVDEGVPTRLTWDEIITTLERCSQDNFWNIP